MADKIVFMYNGKILQIASPEEMLNNPADPVIENFLGKLSYSFSGQDLTCEDVMRTKVLKVPEMKKTLECITLMKHRQINSVVVLDENDKYKGVVGIKKIMKEGKAGLEVRDIVEDTVPTVSINTSAKEAFDLLMESDRDFIVVLNRNKTVAGIITESSITTALASVLWGEAHE
ncbi:MAG TPA: hypothetical protein DHN33_08435 [Eubacteriaceae bacterium]|nr:hypothetical protein [Eubacteriaceae bacterium]